VRTLAVDGRYVTLNGQAAFLAGQMAPSAGKTDSLEELQRIVDVMMLPFGMNLWIGGLGGIDYGAYNEVVNIERGLEREAGRHQYPWLRTGGGPPSAGPDALRALAEAGGAGFFFKMAWARDRGQHLRPDAWSVAMGEFLRSWVPLDEAD